MGDNCCGDGKGGDVGDRQGDAESSVDGLIPTGGVTRRIFWPFFLSDDAVVGGGTGSNSIVGGGTGSDSG